MLQWNPDVATQLVVASDDDRSPTLQMWDLRNSMSPVKEFVGHMKVGKGQKKLHTGLQWPAKSGNAFSASCLGARSDACFPRIKPPIFGRACGGMCEGASLSAIFCPWLAYCLE